MASKAERARTLADHVRRQRPQRFRSKRAAALAADVSRNTWERLEIGADVSDYTYAKLESAMGWPAGSVQRYLDGDADLPQATDESSQDVMRVETVQGMPPQVVSERGPGSEGSEHLGSDVGSVLYRVSAALPDEVPVLAVEAGGDLVIVLNETGDACDIAAALNRIIGHRMTAGTAIQVSLKT
jgi:hypothetical protein